MDKQKIYGIEFDSAEKRGGEHRIMDAANLQNDYVVGDCFQKNNGKNDFDDAYPFGAIRLCNLRLVNGEKQIILAGEPGFDLTGKSGNVMVQIPKFYSRREKEGTVERWMVSGVCHEGFALEPCFLRGGKELEYIYVGAYNSSAKGNGVYSASGTTPDVMLSISEFEQAYAADGYDPYDFAVMLCLQKLCVIELGARQLKQVLGGVCMMKYFSRVTAINCITELGKNRISMPFNERCRNPYFAPGHDIGFGRTAKSYAHKRTVTSVSRNSENPDWVDICYDGEDLSGELAAMEDSAYGIPQDNGKADCLPYHTGRCDLQAPFGGSITHLLCPFRYRYIENLWGNVWEFVSGLQMQDLTFRYTFEPELYAEDSSLWHIHPMKAPEQHLLPDLNPDGPHWINSFGFDPENPLVALPDSASSGNLGDYFGTVINAYKDKDYDNNPISPDIVYSVATGGAWDHKFASPFLYRCFMTRTSKNWLYSNRLCLRK